MKIKANFLYAPSSPQMDDCRIEKVVELAQEEFRKLKADPLAEQPFITENSGCVFSRDGVTRCLLALEKGGRDGVLIQPSGRAYIPGIRDAVSAELERAADFIIRQCTGNAGGGSWHAYFNDRPGVGGCRVGFEELEAQLGLAIRDGNGLDAMLLDALRRRPETSAVELAGGRVELVCDLSLRKDAGTQKEVSAPLTMERKAELFERAVSTVCEIFRGEDLYAMLHDSFGLTIQEIRAHDYLSDQEMAETYGVPEELLDCDMKVRDVLRLDGISGGVRLSCKGSGCLVPLDGLKKLTVHDQEEFAALLDARVADIRVDGETELVLGDVEAAELNRLHDALKAHEHTIKNTGPMMG